MTPRCSRRVRQYFYRARFYKPEVGRFVSEDPLRYTDGINVYNYARLMPLRYTDPTGLKVCKCERRLGFTVGQGPFALYIPKMGPVAHEFIQFVGDDKPCGGYDGTAWGYQDQGGNLGMIDPENTPAEGASLECSPVSCIEEDKLRKNIQVQIGKKGPYKLACNYSMSPGWNSQNCQGWVDAALAASKKPNCNCGGGGW